MGKGSHYRPVDKNKFNDNFDRIFGNGKSKDGGKAETRSDDTNAKVREDKAVRA